MEASEFAPLVVLYSFFFFISDAPSPCEVAKYTYPRL